MALFNHATKEITAKIVYYGPALSGKTTNLVWIHDNLGVGTKSRLVSLTTEQDRTLFFDLLPLDAGLVRGVHTRLQLYTVPGQVFYESIRRMVLKGADAVVFVCDSQAALLEANIASFDSLRENIMANELDPNLPLVVQYNKRDTPSALPVSVLNAAVNPRGILPAFEAVATQGIGVEETLKGITKRLFKSLADLYGSAPPPAEASAGSSPASSPPVGVAGGRPAAPSAAPSASSGAPDASRPRRDAMTGSASSAVPAVTTSSASPSVTPSSAPSVPASAAASPAPASTSPPRPAFPAPPTAAVPVAGAPSDVPPGAPLRPDQWLYLLGGEQRGPVELDDLIDLVLTSIPTITSVWRPGLAAWASADQVPEIAEHIPPPLPFATTEEDFPDFNSVPHMLRVVLIADEDAGFRRLLARPLAAQGFKIHEAKDGAEAWAIATQQRLWLILADLDMAEIDGFEFCRRARSSSLLRHTPLVFISGSDRYKDRYRALQLGADDFLSKQTPIRELLIRIQLLMTRYSDLDVAAGGAGKAGTLVEAGALQGRVEVFGAPAVLQIIYQGQLTGVFTARREAEGGDAAVFGFRHGQIVSASCEDQGGSEAVFAFLTWERGQFNFIPGDPGAGEPIANVEYLLLEGCRRLDEMRYFGDTTPGA